MADTSFENQYRRALQYENQGNYNDYFIQLASLADRGYEPAKKLLKNDMMNEKHLKQDHTVTKQFYEANCNHYFSSYYLGLMYYYGYDVTVNASKAFELLSKSAELNNSMAINKVGTMYLSGFGTKQDFQKASEFLFKAYELNDSTACGNIGAIYYYGYGVKKNNDKAIEYFLKSVEMGNTRSIDNLFTLYKSDKKKYRDEAIRYFTSVNHPEYVEEFYEPGELCRKNMKLETELSNLQKENNILQKNYDALLNHVKASPDGDYFLERMKEWNNRFLQ